MGQCQSVTLDAADRKSALLDKKLAKESKNLAECNVLLLGPGESGKSTLMKQLIHIYGTGYNPEDYRSVIYRNVLNSIWHLIETSENWQRETPFYGVDSSLTIIVEQIKEAYEEAQRMSVEKAKDVFDEEIAGYVAALWKDKGIQAVYGQRSRTQLLDSAAYFFDKVEEIGAKDYVPTTTDIIRSRTRTTGFTEATFTYEGIKMTVTDVGGQRSERKKWLHFFDKSTAVVFFVGLSEYDRTLYEDDSINRMKEAILLFDQICNSRWFQNTRVILFLNKADLFKEKVETVPISDFFPDFTGDRTYEDGCKYFQNVFETKSKFEKNIFTHITSMIDEESIPEWFRLIGDMVIDSVNKSDQDMDLV